MWHIRTHNATSEMYAEDTRARAHARFRAGNENIFQFFFFATWFGVRCAAPLTPPPAPSPPPFMHFHGLIFSTAMKRQKPNRRTFRLPRTRHPQIETSLSFHIVGHRLLFLFLCFLLFSFSQNIIPANRMKMVMIARCSYASRTMRCDENKDFVLMYGFTDGWRLRECARSETCGRTEQNWTYKIWRGRKKIKKVKEAFARNEVYDGDGYGVVCDKWMSRIILTKLYTCP